MPTPDELRTWPFLSIVAWPDGWDRPAVAELFARFAVLDLPTLNMRLGRPPPMVLDRVEPSAAAAAIAALVESGGDGFAFTLDDLARLGPTLRVTDLTVSEGILDLQLPDGLRTVPTASIDVLVRAGLKSTVTTRNPVRVHSGVEGRTRTWDSIKAEVASQATSDVRTTELLTLHAVDGSVYEIDGHRFAYRALGAMRGHGDKANMDAMCELLGLVCRDAVVDGYFELWRPPPGFQQLRVPGMRIAREYASYTFYSRWAALTYRHVSA